MQPERRGDKQARGKRQEARGKRQKARGKRQEARGKRQEARGKRWGYRYLFPVPVFPIPCSLFPVPFFNHRNRFRIPSDLLHKELFEAATGGIEAEEFTAEEV